MPTRIEPTVTIYPSSFHLHLLLVPSWYQGTHGGPPEEGHREKNEGEEIGRVGSLLSAVVDSALKGKRR